MTVIRSLCGAAFLALAASAPASAAPELVVDVASGQVIHAQEATRPWYPASTTKMMTAYVALRALKAGRISLDTPLVASSRAAAQPPSKIGIRPGQEITLDNALKILMVKSANDLAVVIAEGVGGSLDGFARLMNQEAARLGMRESHFINPHGLFVAGQVTSARDLALLGRAMLTEFPQFRDYWGIGAVRLGTRVMRNTNGLIGRYPGAEGMKTGFVCASGFNVVSLASRGGRTIMTVVMGAGSGADRTLKSAQLLDKGFSSWGGGYGALSSLPDSGHGTAPNMREEICRKGRQLYLGEDDDSGGAISMPNVDSGSVYAVMMPQTSGSARSVGGASPGGRATLGARAELPAIDVHLGRAPGSTEVARGPGNGAMVAPAAAFAPLPSAATAAAAAITAPVVRPRPVGVTAEGDGKTAAVGAPLQLPGVITTASPGAIGLRGGAQRNAQPAASGAIRQSGSQPAPPRPGAIAARAAPAKAATTAAKAGTKATPAKTAASTAAKTGTKATAKTSGKTSAKTSGKARQ